MSSLVTAAVIVGTATVYSAKTQADAAKKAAKKQAAAIEKAEQEAAARKVYGEAAEKNITESADVMIGEENDRNTKKRRSRIDLQGTKTTTSTGIGGL